MVPRIYRTRFCSTCYIFRPPLASHCRVCDQCVVNFDHHCYLINNCVGKRNVKYFVLFTNFSLIGSIIFIYSYNVIFLNHWFGNNLSINHSKEAYNDLLFYTYGILSILAFTEILVNYLRWLSWLLGFAYIYSMYSSLFNKELNVELLHVLQYILNSIIMGASLFYSLKYLYYNYQGIT